MAKIVFLSEDSLKFWDKTGKNEFLQYCKKTIMQNDTTTIPHISSEKLTRALYDLCWCCIRGSLNVEQIILSLNEIMETYPDTPLLLADLLGVLDAELSCIDKSEERDRFLSLAMASQQIIPECLLKERLESDLLENIGLIQSKAIYQQKYVKMKTKLYYKQQKFNLLREECEGYAKLITELGQDFNYDKSSHVILLHHIKSLIGCFNLDPNRVLDLILESFESQLDRADVFVPLLEEYCEDKETLCHILGFKFHFFQQPQEEPTKSSLYHLTALLLQHNLITLDFILPHLKPSNSDIVEGYKKDLIDAKQHTARLNSLALALATGAADSANNNNNSKGSTNNANNNSVVTSLATSESVIRDAEDERDEVTGTGNQKFGLCEALFNIGCWKVAQELMNVTLPYAAIAYKPVAITLCKLIGFIIEPMYSKYSGLPDEVIKNRIRSSPAKKFRNFSESNFHKQKDDSIIKIENLENRDSKENILKNKIKSENHLKLSSQDKSINLGNSTNNQQRNHFNTAQAKSFNDFPIMVFPLVSQLGPHLSLDLVLLVKLNRLAKTYMLMREQSKDDSLSPVFCGFLTIYDEAILPSLSLMPGNCCISEEIWAFLKLIRYEYRYRLYGQWKNDSRLQHPTLIRAHAEILNKTKYIMKRLAKENVKLLGRQIGKLCHSAPGIVFEHILSQIQRFDNFIVPVVDSLKFLTSLSYDVLAYCVIEALANPERERMKTDGTNISTWLQSLANFSGSVLKKYQIDIAGLLHYIVNQLKAGKSYDLYILREVIQKMAGIEVSEEVTLDQLMAMGGGELLRQEGGYFSQVRNVKKASGRLMDCLTEHQLTLPLCFLMAQQRNGIVFNPPSEHGDGTTCTTIMNFDDSCDKRHIKLVGKLYDQCQDTLVQFISFLLLQLNSDDLKKRLPNIFDLTTRYFIAPDVAFALWRGIYSADISIKSEELRRLEKKDKNSASISQDSKMHRYFDATEFIMSQIRMKYIEPMMPLKLWEDLKIQFYTTFWCLELYDLEVPTKSYEYQNSIHKKQLEAIDDNKDLAQSKKKKEKERCSALMAKLEEERLKQEDHVKMVLNRLTMEKDIWFSSKLAKFSTITAFLQYCLFPRFCFTAVDAIYCAKFLYILHNLKTQHFSSLLCYDRIFTDISWSMGSCTENEAHRYGRFLCAVFNDLMFWHSDKKVYEEHCLNYPGFVTVFRSPTTTQNQVADHLDYENYRHVVHKWHYSLTRVSVNSFNSGDYVQIRNMLIVLTKILPHYPKIIKLGSVLEKRVGKVVETEKDKRQDLHVHANAYLGQLKATRKTWVSDNLFHKIEKPIIKTTSSLVTPNKEIGYAEEMKTNYGSLKQSNKDNSEHLLNGDKSTLSQESSKTTINIDKNKDNDSGESVKKSSSELKSSLGISSSRSSSSANKNSAIIVTSAGLRLSPKSNMSLSFNSTSNIPVVTSKDRNSTGMIKEHSNTGAIIVTIKSSKDTTSEILFDENRHGTKIGENGDGLNNHSNRGEKENGGSKFDGDEEDRGKRTLNHSHKSSQPSDEREVKRRKLEATTLMSENVDNIDQHTSSLKDTYTGSAVQDLSGRKEGSKMNTDNHRPQHHNNQKRDSSKEKNIKESKDELQRDKRADDKSSKDKSKVKLKGREEDKYQDIERYKEKTSKNRELDGLSKERLLNDQSKNKDVQDGINDVVSSPKERLSRELLSNEPSKDRKRHSGVMFQDFEKEDVNDSHEMKRYKISDDISDSSSRESSLRQNGDEKLSGSNGSKSKKLSSGGISSSRSTHYSSTNISGDSGGRKISRTSLSSSRHKKGLSESRVRMSAGASSKERLTSEIFGRNIVQQTSPSSGKKTDRSNSSNRKSSGGRGNKSRSKDDDYLMKPPNSIDFFNNSGEWGDLSPPRVERGVIKREEIPSPLRDVKGESMVKAEMEVWEHDRYEGDRDVISSRDEGGRRGKRESTSKKKVEPSEKLKKISEKSSKKTRSR